MKNWVPQKASAFRFWITETAVTEFRRLAEHELRSLEGPQLARVLDERLFDAFGAKRSTDVVDRVQPDITTKIVRIEARSGAHLFAVLRPYKHGYPATPVVGGPNGLGLAVVTVVTPEQASADYATKRWTAVNRPFADKLQGVTVKEAPRLTSVPPESAPEEKPSHRAKYGTLIERAEYARTILRERPHISAAGPDGLSAIVEAKFGIGMSSQTIASLREAVEAERIGPAPVRRLTPPPVPVVATPPPGRGTEAVAGDAVALQFAAAIESEKLAKTRVAKAAAELEAAQAIATGATAQVEQLLQQMQARRA